MILRAISQLAAFLVLIAAAAVPASPSIAQDARKPENVMLILDGSGSMWGQIEGKNKIVIAREVVSGVLDDLKDKVNMGVMTYGHRSKGDCKDIETVISVGPVDARRYMSVINKINPKGKTPITDAVRMGADELRFREERATIVLVSDGLETCQADPCALAKELEQQGIDFTVHVVGFDLQNEDTSSLQCLAEETGGRFLAAENADELSDAVGKVVAEVKTAPEPEVKQEAGAATLRVEVRHTEGQDPIERVYVYVIPEAAAKNKSEAVIAGSANRPRKLEPGKYYVEASVGKVKGSTEVEVEAGKENVAEIILGTGLLQVKATEKEGGEPNKKAYIHIYEPEADAGGKRERVAYGNQRIVHTLPAGKYYVTAQIGKANGSQEVEVKPGEKTDVLIVLASGLLKVEASAEEGGKPLKDAYIRIFEAEEQVDGKRNKVAQGNQRNQFSLPAGPYYVTATVGKAETGREVEVKPGELTNISLVLGVGSLKASAVPVEGGKPLAKAYIEVQTAEKTMEGKRSRVTAGNQRNIFKLPAGSYYVLARLGKASAGREVEIKAGTLSEPVINLNAGSLMIKGDKSIHLKVYSAEKNMDGSRDHVANLRPGRALVLPEGKYFIEGKAGKKHGEAEVDISAGKLKEVDFTVE